ncbi:hypothetical protein COLO4_32821 [Corchorus olitorius]|uniref:Uncharacterized protein n=1 Tax=Corchorus olitorius TaxID=93759 RepID=A0A1R3GXY9_9ROSI|nr:hypothetical protein COLO4_32821 [Corchorus olitorius]
MFTASRSLRLWGSSVGFIPSSSSFDFTSLKSLRSFGLRFKGSKGKEGLLAVLRLDSDTNSGEWLDQETLDGNYGGSEARHSGASGGAISRLKRQWRNESMVVSSSGG